jgi:hypothetical protein
VLSAKAEAAVPADAPPLWPVGVPAEIDTTSTFAECAGVQVPDSVTVDALVFAVIWKPLASLDETVRPLDAVPVGVPLDGSMLVLTVAAPVETMPTALATVNVTFCVAVVDASETCAPRRVTARTTPAIQVNFQLIGELFLSFDALRILLLRQVSARSPETLRPRTYSALAEMLSTFG